MRRFSLDLTDDPVLHESESGEYMLVADHEKILSQDVPVAYEKKLQQFDRLRRYAYQVLAEAHQVLWEVDRIPELGEMVEKEAAKNNLMTWQLSQEQYDALVRDAMQWRSAMNPVNDQKQTDSAPLMESLGDMLLLIESGWFMRANDPQGYSSESATILKARNALIKAKKESPQPVDL
jgi:hypothetical protein